MTPIRAVVDDSGVSLPELCRTLLARGLNENLSLDVFRDGAPSFGVKSLHAGQFEHSFDATLLRQENDMRERNGRDQSDPNSGIPRLKVAAAPMPRTAKPERVMKAVPEAEDDDDLAAAAKVLDDFAKLCAERGIRFEDDAGYQQLLGQVEAGDAGPPKQHLVDDQEPEEPLDREIIDKIVKRFERRGFSPHAVEQLGDVLANGPAEHDPVPDFLQGREDELQRRVEHLDRHSASDTVEAIRAVEEMRDRGAFEPGTGERMAERRGSERWWPGRGEAPGTGLPRPGGKQHEPGSLIPDRKTLAADAKFFGVRKRHLKRLARVAS